MSTCAFKLPVRVLSDTFRFNLRSQHLYQFFAHLTIIITMIMQHVYYLSNNNFRQQFDFKAIITLSKAFSYLWKPHSLSFYILQFFTNYNSLILYSDSCKDVIALNPPLYWRKKVLISRIKGTYDLVKSIKKSSVVIIDINKPQHGGWSHLQFYPTLLFISIYSYNRSKKEALRIILNDKITHRREQRLGTMIYI